MAKRIFVLWLIITLVTFSSFSVYAESSLMNFREEEKSRKRENFETAQAVVIKTAETTAETAEREAEQIRKAAEEAAAKERYENYIAGLAAYIRYINGNVSEDDARGMARKFVEFAKKYNVDEKVVMAIAHSESTFYSNAVSSENFKGLMQTGDGLAERAGYDPSQLFSYEVSIEVGASYLSDKMSEFGDTSLALTAYNQGSGSVHSGSYSTGYAETTIARAETIESYLNRNGYVSSI